MPTSRRFFASDQKRIALQALVQAQVVFAVKFGIALNLTRGANAELPASLLSAKR